MADGEITLSNGRKPVNRIGSCFDSAAWLLVGNPEYINAKICHGIGVANMPGQEGEPIAHAWIELDHEDKGRYAVDPIWMVGQPVEKYRGDLKMGYVVEYCRDEFIKLWTLENFPGPYDAKIAALTLEGKQAANG